jgi:aspartyl/asparaginyl beta-hydroxylase (cupin superfamily)
VRGALAKASKVVADNASALGAHLHRRLAGLRRGRDEASLERFDHTVDVLLGRKRAYLPRPAKLSFQALPAVQFFDRAHFPWLASIEAATDSIRAELAAALQADRQDFRAYIDLPAGMPVDQWAELDGSDRWSSYFLWRDGAPVDAHHARCPGTIAALNEVPLFDVPGLGPGAMFSALAPKTRIPPHVGDANVRAVTHLALVIPGGCGFRVGNDMRQWQAGRAWVFDDTFEHEAWNDSDQLRVILIFDVWNPFLSAAEKDAVRELLAGIAEYSGAP